MEYVHAMQLAQSFDDLNEDAPDLNLRNKSSSLLLLGDSVGEGSFRGVLHNNAG